MTHTDLDQAVQEHLAQLVADAPLPPTVDEIVAGRDEARGPRRRPVVLAAAAAFVLLAVGVAVLLRLQSGDGSPTAGPVETDPDLVVVLNRTATDAQVDLIARMLGDPLVTDVVFVDRASTRADVEEQLNELIPVGDLPEAPVSPSYRANVVDHDLGQAQRLVTSLMQSPGVRDVLLDPALPLEPAAIQGELGLLPRLVVAAPGWVPATAVWRESPAEEFEVVYEHRVAVYRTETTVNGERAWHPTVFVHTTDQRGFVGQSPGDRIVDVGGRQGFLGPRQGPGPDLGPAQMLSWWDGVRGVSVMAIGMSESGLLDFAGSVRFDSSGAYVATSRLAGTDEEFRTDEVPTSQGPTAAWSFRRDGSTVQLGASEIGSEGYWGWVENSLVDSPTAETITVRGAEGLLTEHDGDYRVDWVERGGVVAMRLSGHGLDREELLAVLDSLVEVDEVTWQSLAHPSAGETPSTTLFECDDVISSQDDGRSVNEACIAPLPSTFPVDPGESCPEMYLPGDEDGDGIVDTCMRVWDGGG